MARISEELGDVLWYAAMLSTEIGVQLNDVAEGVLTKLEKRMEAGTIKGSGDIR
jgi:NTP pyrophosphatase (non-canonical NTP hydrolase)